MVRSGICTVCGCFRSDLRQHMESHSGQSFQVSDKPSNSASRNLSFNVNVFIYCTYSAISVGELILGEKR